MNTQYKDILEYFKELKQPKFSVRTISENLNIDVESAGKFLIGVKKSGDIHYIVQSKDQLHLTHIDGKEIDWNDKLNEIQNDINTGLFNRSGELLVDLKLFMEYITTIEPPTKEENSQLLKQLGKLKGEKYDRKVLEIAQKNILLTRKSGSAATSAEDLSINEQEILWSYLIRGLCRSVELYDPERDLALSTLSYYWIRQAVQRAKAVILANRICTIYNIEHFPYSRILNKSPEIKKKLGRWPSFNDIIDFFDKEIKEEIEYKKSKKIEKKKKHEERLGRNKIFYILEENEKLIPKEENIEEIKSLISNILNDRESRMITLRYGLDHSVKEYGSSLEEIGQEFDLTRERVRQLIQEGMKLLKFIYKKKSYFLPEDLLPFRDFSPKTVDNLITHEILTISELSAYSRNKLITELGFSRRHSKELEPYTKYGSNRRSIKQYVATLDEAPIDFERLSVRSTNALKRQNIFTLPDLLSLSEEDLYQIPNLGVKSISEISSYALSIDIEEDISTKNKEKNSRS